MIAKGASSISQDCAGNKVFINHNNPSAPMGLVMAKDIDTQFDAGEYARVNDLKFDSLEYLSVVRRSGHGEQLTRKSRKQNSGPELSYDFPSS